jgi:molecular chaperone HscB
MIQCPACAKAQAPRLLCGDCGSPLGADLDLYATIDFPRRLCLDPALLETRYHELSRRTHPDRFAVASAKIRDASVRATALVTRAYRTLRDPISRANYWLELHGRKLGSNNQVPADLAETVFEIQEGLAELNTSEGAEAAEIQSHLTERRREVAQLARARMQELQALFATIDDASEEKIGGLIFDLETILASLAYIRTLKRNLEKALDTRAAA